MIELNTLKQDILKSIDKASSLDDLESVRINALGKKGVLTQALKGMSDLSIEEKKTYGQSLNALKSDAFQKIEEKKKALEDALMKEKLAKEKIDMTLPVYHSSLRQGRIHPNFQVLEEMLAIFQKMGFSLAEGPDIEDDFHCFQALNIPPSHPARQMQATFFMDGKEDENYLLRTHTSTVQTRVMLDQKPPIKIVVPGRVYRCDYDMTHSPMFHQIEGLVIDKKTNMGHLKGCLVEFIKAFFELDDLPFRFRPSYFPFTEPSAEMDIGCSRENGEFKIEAGKGFMEVLGCGMVHPNVLKNCGIDPEEYQGFAFGMGIDRFAMLKYGIPDLRTFFDADMKWLKKYGFIPLNIPNLD
ncbi:MAG: phenylalanine--tRNA ligase subunit alpha [Alphaproteobacteria bacterium]|nr:phenylalanine--tRNA ligase subunit alpha [Alphaproteobacteria bacterium]NCB49087.1 phenylalanine--tRNA ligase subunit alpha [Alphaproteobacteria bacterium]